MFYTQKILPWVIAACLIITSTTVIAQTWTSLNGPQITTNVKDISLDNSGSVVYIAERDYVLKSTNGGTVWFVTAAPYTAPSLVLVKPNEPDKVVVAKNGELRYNASGGSEDWELKIDDPNLVPLRLIAAVNDNNVMLLGRRYNVTGTITIWWSQLGGNDWSPVPGFNAGTDINDFSAIPNNTSGWAVGTIWACGSAPPSPGGQPQGNTAQSLSTNAGLWFSETYGQIWTAYSHGNKNLQSVAIVPRNHPTYYHLYFAENIAGGNDILWKDINRSNPSLAQNIFSGVAEIRMVRYNKNNNTIFLATNDGVYRSTDAAGINGGGTWTKMTGLTDLNVQSITVSVNNTVFAGTASSLYKSTNNGDTWTEVGKMNVSSFTANGSNIWTVTRDNSYAARTTDNGAAWYNSYIFSAGANVKSEQIYRNPNNANLFVSGSRNNIARLYRSQDLGVSYSEVLSRPEKS
ncbi:MAG: hypothetical protein QME52_05285 [Bacteroidota bacterium]|nr:hypothetical protein [Bacteroidota bacterium]